ncbi:hypothetical protein E2N92_10585 [Methanofollis formosanus]|uniref:Uncharacterized protein n=1 Tax=Methanofollis formosanus TaxID=299308 RepID=A0A8G1A3E5_9EURY|nr:hypothetical protein [Methanofollis formosanus]QYZ79840.1 hypothetical protein E2N92_10585 [Methanofollis formosanus]
MLLRAEEIERSSGAGLFQECFKDVEGGVAEEDGITKRYKILLSPSGMQDAGGALQRVWQAAGSTRYPRIYTRTTGK